MIDPEILAHYELGHERDRLAQGISSPIEFARTKEILTRFLPPAPATVLDVGGASGAYATWLAELGYTVHLIDPVPLHIEQARQLSASGSDSFTVALGDARQLEAADGSLDAVLLLGPLYHLIESADRLQALAEAARVARPGGVIVVAGISRFASLLDGLASKHLDDQDFAAIVRDDLETGVHRNVDQRPGWFTTAYFHRPEELRAELVTAGLQVEALLGVEGPGWLTASDVDGEVPEVLLWAARAVEAEPSAVGLSAHLLAIARTGR